MSEDKDTSKRVPRTMGSGVAFVKPIEQADDYFPGKGCQCNAYNADECTCGVDWTDSEIYTLRARIIEAEFLIDELNEHKGAEGWSKGLPERIKAFMKDK